MDNLVALVHLDHRVLKDSLDHQDQRDNEENLA